MRKRTVNSTEWTDEDTQLALALEDYEAGLCPGGPHPLAETSKPEHAGAYLRGDEVECHLCTAQGHLAKAMEEKDPQPAGLMTSMVLDPDRVEQNLKPVPPLPPELTDLSAQPRP